MPLFQHLSGLGSQPLAGPLVLELLLLGTVSAAREA